MLQDKKVFSKYKGLITGPQDLTAGKDPTVMFSFLADRFRFLLDLDPETAVPEKGFKWRKKIHPVIMRAAPSFLTNPQIIENRDRLLHPASEMILPDEGITLPEEPVIFIANHGFKDDVLATVLAAKRHCYLMMASLPQLFNTFDGITAWLNGTLLANRKVAASRKTVVEKSLRILEHRTDLVLFPEGVWNKTPNEPVLDLWPGIYRIAKESGKKVVPIVHYISDCAMRGSENPIHTVVDDPVSIDDLSEKAALSYLRDILATWFYLMLERYGSAKRSELLQEKSEDQYWKEQLERRISTTARYDLEIELCADYRHKDKVRPLDVWKPVAEIQNISPQNISMVSKAKMIVQEEWKRDYQRRF